MDGVEVKFDVTQLTRAVRRYEQRTKNLPMDLMGQLLINATEEMFETEGAAGEQGAWRPLQESTLKRNPRRAGGRILQATGATANIQVKEVSEYSVTIESPTDYAAWHLDGTDVMPARDFFAFRFGKVLEAMGDLALQEYAR